MRQSAFPHFLRIAAAVLAVLALTGELTLAFVYVIAFVTGIAIVFDAPSRQNLTFQMVGRDELPNAIALLSVCRTK